MVLCFISCDTQGDGALAAVNAVRSTLASTRHYLATSTNRTIEHDIANTARKYGISYTRETTVESDEVDMVSVPEAPVEVEVQVINVRGGLKSALRLKKV